MRRPQRTTSIHLKETLRGYHHLILLWPLGGISFVGINSNQQSEKQDGCHGQLSDNFDDRFL